MQKYLIGLYIFFVFGKTGFQCQAQNNARLYSSDGRVFKVWLGGKAINNIAQASVLIENVLSDTLQLKIEFENNKILDAVIYLLDKGKKTQNKEYNYKISAGEMGVKTEFSGITLPSPSRQKIVPASGSGGN